MTSADLLAPYRSPEALTVCVKARALAVGGECVEYGRSVAGVPLLAVRVPARRQGAPKVLCCANIHGPELVATEVALGLLAALDGGVAEPLREAAEVWIAPSLNPDGHRRTFELAGDAALSRMRTNDRGVDLNRNYPLPGGRVRRTYGLPGAGSTRPGEATYIGESPLSEPETAALDRLARAQRFVASANLHSFMGTVIPARVTDRACYRHYKWLCRTLSAAQPTWRYRRVANRIVDVFTGEQEDHQHHNLDCWAACIETFSLYASFRQHLRAPTTFWRFNPRAPAPWVDNDILGLVAFFRASLTLPRPTEAATTSSQTDL